MNPNPRSSRSLKNFLDFFRRDIVVKKPFVGFRDNLTTEAGETTSGFSPVVRVDCVDNTLNMCLKVISQVCIAARAHLHGQLFYLFIITYLLH